MRRAEFPAEELARAKLTMSLRVEGTRSDGYHLINSIMVNLELADRLTFSRGTGLEVKTDFGSGGHVGEPIPPDRTNLVERALDIVDIGAHVLLEKRIPAGAGLGGGSADAAAVLRWAGFDDLQRAATLGADVPFCLIGGAAKVSGVGEIIEPIDFAKRHIVLLTPPFGMSTVAVYYEWDRMGGPTGEGPNDLESAAISLEPRLTYWRDVLEQLVGRRPVMAGSGSTWFAELDADPQSLGISGTLAQARAELAAQGALLTVTSTQDPISESPDSA
ncbi:MAG TPA: 4-(cytidine 5'-diphospho)-2-C-methyl-D-erythritol kinase [Acidimicrobiales bacterium]|nr:4-(cytidine 5'-diphospho)-2-C-methyl-D-erythritol kinase [Acidimicrobiales bacterium]